MAQTFEQWYEEGLKQYVTDVFCEKSFDLNWIESILYSAYEAGYDEGFDTGFDVGNFLPYTRKGEEFTNDS